MQHTHADGSESHNADRSLWGIYTRGMDEWVAAKSRRDAEAWALKLNQVMIAQAKYDEHDPWMWAIPDLWPGSAEDHAAQLDRQDREDAGLRPSHGQQ